MSPVRVLFLCTGNSARSVIAEALLKSIGGDEFEVYSAGTRPKGLNPFTAKVLEQARLDITGFRSKSISEFEGQKFDYVITVCDSANEECPVFPGAPERIHWSFPDPAAVDGTDLIKLAAFQTTLREMNQRLSAFALVSQRSANAD
jgi:arsenate reductase